MAIKAGVNKRRTTNKLRDTMKIKVLTTVSALVAGIAGQAAIVYFQWPIASGGNDHWYGLTERALSWTEAEAVAVTEGGHLASIGSAAEEGFLATTFGGARFWIGFNDAASEGTWVWSDGSPVTYTNWAPGEPNNLGDEDYAVMNWSGVQWNDLPDLGGYTYGIVERVVIPEPSAYTVMAAGLMLGFGVWRRIRSSRRA